MLFKGQLKEWCRGKEEEFAMRISHDIYFPSSIFHPWLLRDLVFRRTKEHEVDSGSRDPPSDSAYGDNSGEVRSSI